MMAVSLSSIITIGFFAILLSSVGIKGEEEPNVEIDEFWGTIDIPAGKSGSAQEEFSCVASNVDKNGKFVWSIGNKEMPNENEVQDLSQGDMTKFEQTYVMDLSTIEDTITELDQKKFLCRYVQTDSWGETVKLPSQELTLKVTVQDLPPETIPVSDLKIGDPATLSVQMEIYPPPQNDHYVWLIEDKRTKENKEEINIVQVKPGETLNGYAAEEIKHLGKIKYEAVLVIKNMTKEIESKSIYMSVNSGNDAGNGNDLPRVYFNLTLKAEPIEPEVGTMNLGIWIILAIIVVIIIICVVYCIVNGQCCKKKDDKSNPGPKDPKKGDYQPPPQQKDINDVEQAE